MINDALSGLRDTPQSAAKALTINKKRLASDNQRVFNDAKVTDHYAIVLSGSEAVKLAIAAAMHATTDRGTCVDGVLSFCDAMMFA